MTRKELGDRFSRQLNCCAEIMGIKNGGYGTDDEALHNFVLGAQLQAGTLQQSLGGYLAKHIASIYDLINEGEPVADNMTVWHEKITDAMVYLGILHAICEAEYEYNNPVNLTAVNR